MERIDKYRSAAEVICKLRAKFAMLVLRLSHLATIYSTFASKDGA
jgi:hypothetical protein